MHDFDDADVRFIGLILLPLVGNAAEHVTSVWMACKGKMELTIGVAVGSSIQIAAGMIPLLVLIAWPLHKDLTLFFVGRTHKNACSADVCRLTLRRSFSLWR